MNCDNHCSAKCKMLGGLEQKIMEVLWSKEVSQKPSDIVKSLSGNYAYTTITTVLKRMSDKNIVKRKQVGNVFYYQTTSNKKDFACTCLDDLFVRLFETYGSDVVTSFLKISKQEKYLS